MRCSEGPGESVARDMRQTRVPGIAHCPPGPVAVFLLVALHLTGGIARARIAGRSFYSTRVLEQLCGP
jgi:hypothetical protein